MNDHAFAQGQIVGSSLGTSHADLIAQQQAAQRAWQREHALNLAIAAAGKEGRSVTDILHDADLIMAWLDPKPMGN
jgi:hypothetical protein